MSRTLIIAEAGVNHNGDMQMAERMIEVAANAGADFVKFQTFSADKLVTADAPTAEYQSENLGDDKTSQRNMLKKLELNAEMHDQLVACSKKNNIKFLSTAFEIESLQYLINLGIELIKIPSGEITNLPYLREIGRSGLPVIMSTGMANLGEIEAAVASLEAVGTQRKDLTVLHCTTQYPTPYKDVNLSAMKSIADSMKVKIGYSDHTLGITVPIAAVAMGATVIEKHFTLDRNLEGPDHAASLEPAELKAMVQGIRDVELVIGDGIKRPQESERANIGVARKSIVAKAAIKSGEAFSEQNLTTIQT